MDLSYKTVVNYVKNLFPGVAQVAVSDNPQLDVKVMSYLAMNKLYLVARNGHLYWYCFVNNQYLPVAKYILRSNGVNANLYYSRYYYGEKKPVLRIRMSKLKRNSAGLEFVESVMKSGAFRFDEQSIENRRFSNLHISKSAFL